jgi:uncharacterized protein DUF5678
MDANQLINELNRKTLEELAPYQGQWVAWSQDGKAVLAHGLNENALYQEIDRLALKKYVIDYVPRADEDFIGGALL